MMYSKRPHPRCLPIFGRHPTPPHSAAALPGHLGAQPWLVLPGVSIAMPVASVADSRPEPDRPEVLIEFELDSVSFSTPSSLHGRPFQTYKAPHRKKKTDHNPYTWPPPPADDFISRCLAFLGFVDTSSASAAPASAPAPALAPAPAPSAASGPDNVPSKMVQQKEERPQLEPQVQYEPARASRARETLPAPAKLPQKQEDIIHSPARASGRAALSPVRGGLSPLRSGFDPRSSSSARMALLSERSTFHKDNWEEYNREAEAKSILSVRHRWSPNKHDALRPPLTESTFGPVAGIAVSPPSNRSAGQKSPTPTEVTTAFQHHPLKKKQLQESQSTSPINGMQQTSGQVPSGRQNRADQRPSVFGASSRALRAPAAGVTPFAKTSPDNGKERASQRSQRRAYEEQEATRRVFQRPGDISESHDIWESVFYERPSGLPPKQQDQKEGADYVNKVLNEAQRRAEIERLAKLQRLRANWLQEGNDTSRSVSRADRKSARGRLYAVSARFDPQAPAPRVYGK